MDKATANFLKKVVRQDGCWGWLGSFHNSGYAQIPLFGRVHYGHRISYQLAKGEIPDGMDVMHLCHNPACTNPDHLELGTRSENMRTSQLAGRLQRKIPLSDLPIIREQRMQGMTMQAIGNRYGCTKQAVRHMLKVAAHG